MKILITNSSPEPIYEQIKNELKRQIVTDELRDGELLPSIRKLAMDLGISVITTKRAYDDLEKEGLLASVAGKGSFVASKNKDLIKEKKLSLIEAMLAEAVAAAKTLGIRPADLKRMLATLIEED